VLFIVLGSWPDVVGAGSTYEELDYALDGDREYECAGRRDLI
jgi:hypothetical protein